MAFMKYARATVIHPHVSKTEWGNIRVAGRQIRSGHMNENLVDRASELVGRSFNPSEFLLTHATIVASVDVYVPSGIKTGSVLEDGFRVNRKFGNFRIQPGSDKHINNNFDSWSRGTLLKAYPTFIGGHSFVEHVQVEDLSKGRIIDAVARDVGDSIYVDILIANDRKHKDLIAAIEGGNMSTLSMGCFLPHAMVSLADGTRVPIKEVFPGELVITHKGRIRPVANQQIRYGDWKLRRIQAVGVNDEIPATDFHPFFVYRAPQMCACGCGEPLPTYSQSKKKPTVRSMSRRFKRGHDKRIFNPKNTYSLVEYRERMARKDALQAFRVEEVRAADLRVGDFLCFPRVQFGEDHEGATVGRARLLGYFLAEGSFLKRGGKPVEVQFNFSLTEKETYVAEVVRLLAQEFPGANPAWVQDRPDRNTCTVHVTGAGVPEWFYKHGGEYSHRKRLSAEVLQWPVEMHKHLIGTWINGDAHRCENSSSFGSVGGTTASYDLGCQLHLLMSRVGLFARMAVTVQGKAVEIRDVVNGGVVLRDEATGRLPSFGVYLGQTFAHRLAGYTDKAPATSTHKDQSLRVLDDMVMFPITKITDDTYTGAVYDLEVEEDHSYLVEGVAVHNCTVDGTQCTKCGHWAADETEMCPHVKYAKGNTFYDENGQRHRIAELCGNEGLDPTGGVQFIEASWVGTPAFTGAVLRNVLEPTVEVSRKAQQILSTPPPQWSTDAQMKAARIHAVPPVTPDQYGRVEIARIHAASVASSHALIGRPGNARQGLQINSDDEFMAGWDDVNDDAAAEDTPASPDSKPKSPFQDVEDDIYKTISDRVKDRIKKDLAPKVDAIPPEESANTNENMVKEASHRMYRVALTTLVRASSTDAHLMDAIAVLNAKVGIRIPVEIYRGALQVGAHHRYASVEAYRKACHNALGRELTVSEVKTLLRLGKVLSLRRAQGNLITGSRHKERTHER